MCRDYSTEEWSSSAVDCNDNQLVIREYMYIISGLSWSIFTTKLVNAWMQSNHIYDRVITHCLILYQAFVQTKQPRLVWLLDSKIVKFTKFKVRDLHWRRYNNVRNDHDLTCIRGFYSHQLQIQNLYHTLQSRSDRNKLLAKHACRH